MTHASGRIILASASPRRRELLGRFGLAFEVMPSRVSEGPQAGERAAAYAERMARAKALEVAERLCRRRPRDGVCLGRAPAGRGEALRPGLDTNGRVGPRVVVMRLDRPRGREGVWPGDGHGVP